jgi:diaminopimelate epimerase
MMQQLNLPPANLRLKRKEDQTFVFCVIRKKELLLTPEEWVRQHLIHYLIEHRNISKGLISAEMSIEVNGLSRRCDLVVFSKEGKPQMIVECKAPDIAISEQTFRQIAQYNHRLQVSLLLMSNGIDHFIARVDQETGSLQFIEDLPEL